MLELFISLDDNNGSKSALFLGIGKYFSNSFYQMIPCWVYIYERPSGGELGGGSQPRTVAASLGRMMQLANCSDCTTARGDARGKLLIET